MRNFVLSCCSTADLNIEYFTQRDIHYICFHYSLNGITYKDDLGQTISFKDFYKELSKGAITKTTQINVNEYEEYFEKFLIEGKDIVHLTLSSGISGSYNSALMAQKNLSIKYPNRKIFIIDSLAASSGYGLLMDKLADLRDKGYTAEEITYFAETHKLELHHWFFSTDLSYYVKGGRISKASGLFGTLLKICPLLNVDSSGRLTPQKKCIGKRMAMIETIKRMTEFAFDGNDYSDNCFISNSGCEADAETLKTLVETNFPKLLGKVKIFSIGTTIGSHTGQGTVALYFWGNKRTN